MKLYIDEVQPFILFIGADTPLCMRFWTHMYGNGIGALRVIIKPTQGDEEIIWELKGEQGNNWYQGQVTITAVTDFQVGPFVNINL